MLIGLGHAAGTGKGEVAQILVRDYGFTHLSFAEPVRQVAYYSMPNIRRLVDQEGWDVAKNVFPSVRLALVDLGVAMRRHLAGDVLIRSVFTQIKPENDYVISDLRFRPEVGRIFAAGGYCVKVTRPGVCPLRNAADQALAGYRGWSATIENDGSLDDLKARVVDVLGPLVDA